MNAIGNLQPQMTAMAMKDVAPASVRKAPSQSFTEALNQPKSAPAPTAVNEPVAAAREDNASAGNSTNNANESGQSSRAVDRQKAMSVFLEKMRAQLGVEPEEIVEAFAQLELSDLALPPEDTIDKVIGRLDLNEEEKKVASDLYSEMLAMSAAASMSQYLEQNQQTAQVEVISAKEASRRELNKNIAAMSEQFFAQPRAQMAPQTQPAMAAMKKAQAGQAYGAPMPKPATAAPARLDALNVEHAMSANLPPVNPPAMDPALMSPEAIAQNPMPAIQELEKELAMLEKLSPNDPDLPAMKQSLEQLKEAVQIPAEEMMENVPKVDLNAVKAKAAAEAYAQPNVTAPAMKSGSEMGADFGANTEDSKDPRGEMNLDDIGLVEPRKAHTVANKDFIINAPKPTTADVQANIKELINQAQFLAKKGGGEMKVKLTPEGLGEVNIKVGLENGQLNVEMITDNHEAKKILEKGIGELKASLAEHKLHLEHIKIESPKDAANQFSQQFDQAEQQFQQRFLQDFRDQNSNMRRELFDFGPARMPGSNTRDEASNGTYDPNANKRRTTRRLDLVA